MSSHPLYRDLINKIRVLPGQIESSVKGLSDSQLDTPYREGGWTVRQVVHHLADSHMNAYIRMRLIVTEDHPTLKPYDQDEWARQHDAAHDPLAASMNILKGLHPRWTNFLESLPDTAWKRTAHHPEIGEVSLEDLLKIYADHGENHVGQIDKLRAAQKW